MKEGNTEDMKAVHLLTSSSLIRLVIPIRDVNSHGFKISVLLEAC
jgi:hypothetical protein